MKANGTGERQVTVGAGATFPDYSPDGSRIAYGGFADGDSEVYVIDADGTDVVQLTSDPAFDELPAWSPDGSKIAFLSDRTGMSQVWLMDSDGSDQTQLTTDLATKTQLPDWSPDGSRIAYASSQGLSEHLGDRR